MTNPKYTFLLPAYKAKYFAEALQSLKVQEFEEFKAIVSDDCSPEDLKSIFDNVVGDDPRFTYRRNEVNMGGKSLVSHWNLLVDMCDTEYFIMASDDDVYEPNYLKEIDELIVKYPECDMFRGKMRYIDGEGKLLKKDPLVEEHLDRLHYLTHYYNEHILSCEACYCYRTAAVKTIGNYKDFPLAWFTDDAQHIQMSKKGVAITQSISFNYRHTELSISGGTDGPERSRKKVVAALMFYEWFVEYFKTIEDCEEPWLRDDVNWKIRGRISTNITIFSRYLLWKDIWWLCKNIKGRLQITRPILLYWWWKWRKIRATREC